MGFTAKTCVQFTYLSWLITPIGTQSYQPTMPLLVRDTMGEPVWMLGIIYSTKMFCSVVGYAMLLPLLRYFSPRAVTMGFLVLRGISGLLHGLGTIAITDATLPILFIRSAMHGISLGALGLGPTWIGARLPPEERIKHQTGILAVLGVGFAFGPLTGSICALLLPTDLADQSAPGWVTLATSLLLMALAWALFDDTELLPAPKAKDHAVELTPKERTTFYTCVVNALFTFMSTIGSESITALLFKDMYGLNAEGSFAGFLTIGLSTLSAGVFFMGLAFKLNLATIVIIFNVIAIVPLAWIIHYSDFTEYVSYEWLLIGFFLFFAGVQMSLSAHNSLLSVRIPQDHQAAVVPMVQLTGQLGRAFGPIFFTNLYAIADATAAGTAPNWALLAQGVLLILGNLAPALFYTTVYGSFSDPPFGEQKQAAQKEALKEML